MQAEDFVETEYVLKIRADLMDTVPNEWIEEGLRQIYINSSRIVITQFFTKNPRYVNQYGHPSDMIMLSRKSELFNYFRNTQRENLVAAGYLAPEQMYFFSHTLNYPDHTYSFNLATIRSHIKVGKIFYVNPLANFQNIFSDRFVRNNNVEIRWGAGNFVQYNLYKYLFFAIVNKLNLRRFIL